jgi:hypothetical protein
MGRLSSASVATAAYVASRLATANRLHSWFPAFAAHDPVSSDHPWFQEVRGAYADLCARRAVLAKRHTALDADKYHHVDGVTVAPAYRPKGLPLAKSMPPFERIVGTTSDLRKPPKQGVLVSVIRIEDWHECLEGWRQWDADHPLARSPDRCATNFISMSQTGADAWLRLLPTSRGARIISSHFLWSIQRRLNLHVTAPRDVFAACAARGDVYDAFGDRLVSEATTDRSAPHTDALRVLYAAHEATAPGPVVYGDKANADHYRLFNEDCCLDVGERGQGPGGFDLVVELKAWDQLRASGFTAAIPRRGDTHGFGNTLAPAFYKVLDVAARAGPHAWNPATGTGRVDAHDGDYHDALANKRSTVVLFLVELSGALSPPAKRHLRWLAARAKRRDRTQYESWAAATFMSYWLQRISAAIVGGDARRAFTAISKRAGLLT